MSFEEKNLIKDLKKLSFSTPFVSIPEPQSDSVSLIIWWRLNWWTAHVTPSVTVCLKTNFNDLKLGPIFNRLKWKSTEVGTDKMDFLKLANTNLFSFHPLPLEIKTEARGYSDSFDKASGKELDLNCWAGRGNLGWIFLLRICDTASPRFHSRFLKGKRKYPFWRQVKI